MSLLTVGVAVTNRKGAGTSATYINHLVIVKCCVFDIALRLCITLLFRRPGSSVGYISYFENTFIGAGRYHGTVPYHITVAPTRVVWARSGCAAPLVTRLGLVTILFLEVS